MTPISAAPTTTSCGLCGAAIAYGQRQNHARVHGLHAWRIVWSPAGAFPCTAHKNCLATGFAYGTRSKLDAHIARLKLYAPEDDPADPTSAPQRLCSVCGRPEKASGLCTGHLTRRERGLPDWDAPLRTRRKPPADRAQAAQAVLERHGIHVTVELPLPVLERLAAVLTAHENAED